MDMKKLIKAGFNLQGDHGGYFTVRDGVLSFPDEYFPDEDEINLASQDTPEEISEALRISEITTEKENSGLKKVTISQANSFIESKVATITDVPSARIAIEDLFKKIIPFIINGE